MIPHRPTIVRLLRDGLPDSLIALRLGVRRCQVKSIRHQLKLPASRPRNRPWQEWERELLRATYAERMPLSFLCLHLKRSMAAVKMEASKLRKSGVLSPSPAS